jgi:hypothetical protein
MSTDQLNSFVLFLPPEHRTPLVFFGSAPLQAIASLQPSPLPCAWCLAEEGQPMGSGSHGMCRRHKLEQRAQLARFRARQQQQVLFPTS